MGPNICPSGPVIVNSGNNAQTMINRENTRLRCTSPEDRKIANPKLTASQRARVATAVNINASDIDFCEYKGRLRITYCWGNQRGIEHLGEAIYDGTEASFLEGWFRHTSGK